MPLVLRIPEKHKPSFAFLAHMSDETFVALRDALANTQPTFGLRDYAERATAKQESSTFVEILELVQAVVPIISRISDVKDIGILSSSLAEAAHEERKLNITDDDKPILEHRLRAIFELEETIGTVAKARAIFQAQGHDFCDVKIITDIRPIFRLNASVEPTSVVVVHTLRIGYHGQGDPEHRDFAVTVDDDALDALESAVRRAKEKAKTSVRMIEKSGALCLEPASL